jgi:hypothetical protein
MMLVSMAGQASFHTAERSGPSTMDRSYRGVAGARGTSATDGVSMGAGAVTSVNGRAEGESGKYRAAALLPSFGR